MTRANPAAISGSGLFTPRHGISNEELVAAYNAYADARNAADAESGTAEAVESVQKSSVEFIVKASGINHRYVMVKDGILDVERMAPVFPHRSDDDLSLTAEIAVAAAGQALEQARLQGSDLDAIIVACSNMERPYPAMAIEVQAALGARGFGYDMNVACSSATFGIQNAVDAVTQGSATRVLVVNPEITSAHLNWRDRDGHFIFGDVCTAVIVESAATAQGEHTFDILGTRLVTKYSNNIRNNFGFMNREPEIDFFDGDKLFRQNGRKVFKEVSPMAATHIQTHLDELGLDVSQIRRFWLHQANINMNRVIAKRLLGRDGDDDVTPVVLDQYANTSSAGSIIAYHLHQADFKPGDLGVICSFGAGYSIGSVVVRKH